ncbi:hypothetical protein Droror1_Dr00019059 [Drosera rotundifolia]
MRGAQFMFDEMLEKNEISWTSMIVVYLELERLGDARRVFDEMIRKGGMGIGVVSCGDGRHWRGEDEGEGAAKEMIEETAICIAIWTEWRIS